MQFIRPRGIFALWSPASSEEMSGISDFKKSRQSQIQKERLSSPSKNYERTPAQQVEDEMKAFLEGKIRMSDVAPSTGPSVEKSEVEFGEFQSPPKSAVSAGPAGAARIAAPADASLGDEAKTRNTKKQPDTRGSRSFERRTAEWEEEDWDDDDEIDADDIGLDMSRITDAEKALDAITRKAIVDATSRSEFLALPEKSANQGFEVFLSHVFESLTTLLGQIRVLVMDSDVLCLLVDTWCTIFSEFRLCTLNKALVFVQQVIAKTFIFSSVDAKLKILLEKAIFSYSRYSTINMEYENLKCGSSGSGTIYVALVRRSMLPSVEQNQKRAIDRIVNRGSQNLYPVHISQIVGHAENFLKDFSQQDQIQEKFAVSEYLDTMVVLYPSSKFPMLADTLSRLQREAVTGVQFSIQSMVEQIRHSVATSRTHTEVLFNGPLGNAETHLLSDARAFSRQVFKSKKEGKGYEDKKEWKQNAYEGGKQGRGGKRGGKTDDRGGGQNAQTERKAGKKGQKKGGKGNDDKADWRRPAKQGGVNFSVPSGFCIDHLVYSDCKHGAQCRYSHEKPSRDAKADRPAKGAYQHAAAAATSSEVFNFHDAQKSGSRDIFNENIFKPGNGIFKHESSTSDVFSFSLRQFWLFLDSDRKAAQEWLEKAIQDFEKLVSGREADGGIGRVPVAEGEALAAVAVAEEKQCFGLQKSDDSKRVKKVENAPRANKFAILFFESEIESNFEKIDEICSFVLPESKNEEWRELIPAKKKKKPGAKSRSLKEVEVENKNLMTVVEKELTVVENYVTKQQKKDSDRDARAEKQARSRFLATLRQWKKENRMFLVDSGANLSNVARLFSCDDVVKDFNASVNTVGGSIAVREGASFDIGPGVRITATVNNLGPNLLALCHVVRGTKWVFTCVPDERKGSGVAYFFEHRGIRVELPQDQGLPLITGEELEMLERLSDDYSDVSNFHLDASNFHSASTPNFDSAEVDEIVDFIFQNDDSKPPSGFSEQNPARKLLNKSKVSGQRKADNEKQLVKLSEEAREALKGASLTEFLENIRHFSDVVPTSAYDLSARIKHRRHSPFKSEHMKLFDINGRQNANPSYLKKLSADTGKFGFFSYLNRQYFNLVRDEGSGELFGDSRSTMTASDTVSCFRNIFSKDQLAAVVSLHTDNGTEFMNDEVAEYLKSFGIVQSTTNDYCHSENSHIENSIQLVKVEIENKIAM